LDYSVCTFWNWSACGDVCDGAWRELSWSGTSMGFKGNVVFTWPIRRDDSVSIFDRSTVARDWFSAENVCSEDVLECVLKRDCFSREGIGLGEYDVKGLWDGDHLESSARSSKHHLFRLLMSEAFLEMLEELCGNSSRFSGKDEFIDFKNDAAKKNCSNIM
jgi:hypothetical protein